MGNFSRKTRSLLVVAAFVVVGLAALIPLVANPATSAPREIVLVARDMTFYVEGSNEPNPTLAVRAGEEIRVVVRNQEPGITHGFDMAALRVSLGRIDPGATASLVIKAPSEPGRYDYVCPPHAQMMRGVMLVTP